MMMMIRGLRKARRMVKDCIPLREIRKYLSTLKKKNILLGTYEPLTKKEVNYILLSLEIIH